MRAWRRSFGLAAAVLMLASCAMGPDYERPEGPVPEGLFGL